MSASYSQAACHSRLNIGFWNCKPFHLPVLERFVAYDRTTVFGLARTKKLSKVRTKRLGGSGQLLTRTGGIVAGFDGYNNTIRTIVIDRRNFADFWEYSVPEIVFTQPPSQIFRGATQIELDSRLVGVSFLIIGNAKLG